jgi:hypothetical protein
MAEAELNIPEETDQPKSIHLEWLLPILIRPKSTLETIRRQEYAVWLGPLLLLTVFALLLVVAGGAARVADAQNGVELPPYFQDLPPDMQNQFQDGLSARQNPVFVYVFPALSAIAGIWIGWFLLSSFLHLSLTLAGSRSSNTAAMNLVAWASVPFVFRFIVRAIYALSARSLVTTPGLSGFIAADAAGFTGFIRMLLAFVDIYLIWQVVLLLIGVVPLSGLTRVKAWGATLVSVVLLLVLQALPLIIASQLSGLGNARSFFFF